ncbi:MAG: 4-hydroxybutyrate CoA-transferase [Clostridiales Family XIII bacterium]|nr:4-hydroxybutyrate CoA-transferase [Clostridiales Family XIII bacterium]
MDWREQYKNRLCTATAAVKHIKSGDAVVLAHCVGEPPVLVEAMVANAAQYEDVEIKHMVSLGPGVHAAPGMEKHFRVNPLFASANTRAAIAVGRGDFTPAFFHEIPKFFREGKLRIDVLLLQVSPPDDHGYCSLGPSVDYTLQAITSAKTVIAQVNAQVPFTYGDGIVRISAFDHIVEADSPIYEIQPPKIGDVERAIGEHCAALVEDGSTLQLGIGAIPDAVMLFLKNKKDLGIHSEMISDGTLALFEAGVITGARKSMNKGRMTVAFLMGTRKLYDFAHRNPAVEIRPVDYVNHPITISKQYRMVSINSAMEVDLMGQVNAETIGSNQFSGVGGQVDFIRGVAMGDGGKAIIAMPSVTVKKDGSVIPKIVPFLEQGSAITTSRNDVDYVVTEYGAALLKAQSLRQRARNLIGIAHPDHRDRLTEAFEKRFGEKP